MKSATRHFTFAIMAVAATFFANSRVSADAPSDTICEYASEIVCVTGDMKDEIKCHFLGAKGYGRLLAANAVVKAKAAQIKRRVHRNPCYSRLVHDANRLDEKVCKLQEQFEQALLCSSYKRPINGDPADVAALLADMRALSKCLKAEACVRLGLAPPVVVAPVVVPPAPVHTHRLPVPAVPDPLQIDPILEEVPFNAPNFPQVEPRSILELETDPILELPRGY